MTTDPNAIPDNLIEAAVDRDILNDIQSNLNENTPQEPLVYFCKDCRKLIHDPKPISKKNPYSFRCPDCKEKSVAWGTKRSIYSFFHLTEEGEATERKKERGTRVAQLKEAREEKLSKQAEDQTQKAQSES